MGFQANFPKFELSDEDSGGESIATATTHSEADLSLLDERKDQCQRSADHDRPQRVFTILAAIVIFVIAFKVGSGVSEKNSSSPPPSPPPTTTPNSEKSSSAPPSGIRDAFIFLISFAASIIVGRLAGDFASFLSSSIATAPPLSLPRPRDGTGLAITSWRSRTNEKELHLRLFYQTDSGELRERFWDSASGWSTYSSVIGDPPIIAKNNTPLAQATWCTLGGAREIQLFYLNAENIICDVIYSNSKWTRGRLEGYNFSTGEDSKLGATVWREKKDVLAYFQDEDGYLIELHYIEQTNKWMRYNQALLNLKMAKGAGIGAFYGYWGGAYQIRIYTQTEDRTIVEKGHDSKWRDFHVLYKSAATPLGTSIAATLVNTEGENHGCAMFGVYFVGERGIVRKLVYNSTKGWNYDPRNLVEGDNSGGSIAAVNWEENDARMVFKNKGGLGEMVLDGESNWDASGFSM